MQKLIAKTCGYFLDMIFPISCLKCGRNREDLPEKERWICPDCLSRANIRLEQVCPVCEKESEGGKVHFSCRDKVFLDGIWACAYYDDFIEKAVHEFKFNFLKGLSYPLSQIMIKSILEAPEFGDFQDLVLVNFSKEEEDGIYADEEKNRKIETIIVPVPLHKKRYNWRGFNQSSLLAESVARRFSLPLCEDVLLRVKNTKPQSKTKNEEERRKNINSAFLCPNKALVKNKNFILVDDVCTTSATLNECAKELKQAGAKNVWGLVAARR